MFVAYYYYYYFVHVLLLGFCVARTKDLIDSAKEFKDKEVAL